jgi:hypothetical protein
MGEQIIANPELASGGVALTNYPGSIARRVRATKRGPARTPDLSVLPTRG